MYNNHVCFVVGGNAFDCAFGKILRVLKLFKLSISACGEINKNFNGKHKQTTGDLKTQKRNARFKKSIKLPIRFSLKRSCISRCNRVVHVLQRKAFLMRDNKACRAFFKSTKKIS